MTGMEGATVNSWGTWKNKHDKLFTVEISKGVGISITRINQDLRYLCSVQYLFNNFKPTDEIAKKTARENFPWKFDRPVGTCVACGRNECLSTCRTQLDDLFGSLANALDAYRAAEMAREATTAADATTAMVAKFKENFPEVQKYMDMVRNKTATSPKPPEKPSKRPCTVCTKPIGHSNYDHAVFCSSACAAAAAVVYKSSDRALRFLAGLNLQDHPTKNQREARDIVQALIKVMRPEAK